MRSTITTVGLACAATLAAASLVLAAVAQATPQKPPPVTAAPASGKPAMTVGSQGPMPVHTAFTKAQIETAAACSCRIARFATARMRAAVRPGQT